MTVLLRTITPFWSEAGMSTRGCTHLKWQQINLDKKHALVHADESKTKRAIPIPLNKQALTILQSQKGKHPIYVFTYEGRPVTRCNNHAWRKALIRAGISDFRWHDLRHTWAIWNVQNGAIA